MGTETYQDSLYGQILPSSWDEDIVSEIVLLVDGEEEFNIENDEFSKILSNYIDRWVSVQGLITEDEEEIRIKIHNYTLEDEMNFGGDDTW
ncbi:hypothetical protein [Maridesulfovibrio sp.]|uniref:hypothetical protein n=1 Tax=Maridesulfovibrio sp. TaxID=2795000 RepID=UPI0029CA7224|nr:hypothetical protein [Maridesulfovibrio sp.]